jgi:NAD(P)-dependent dehydrogenase (short-subunit alcohol dehydrogenase family)
MAAYNLCISDRVFQKAAEEIEKLTMGKGVDYLINNAGLVAKPTAFRTLKD